MPKINVKVPSQVVTHIEDAMKIVPENSHVYVTGSLHLVGRVLSFIQPDTHCLVSYGNSSIFLLCLYFFVFGKKMLPKCDLCIKTFQNKLFQKRKFSVE